MNKARRTLGQALSLAGLLSGACDAGDRSSQPDIHEGRALDHRAGGQTGDEGATGWAPPGASADRRCPWLELEPLDSLETDTELGFSAADVLGFVAGRHAASVHWNAEPAAEWYALRVTPSGDDALELKISHDGATPRFRGVVKPDGGAIDCHGELVLGVTVELRSASGALDEHWVGTLAADRPNEARLLLRAPVWRGRFPGQPDRDEAHFDNALEGTLDVVDADDPGSAFAWIDVVLRVTPDAVHGSVNGWVQDGQGGAFLIPAYAVGSGEDASPSWIGVIGDGYYTNPWAVE